MFWLHQNRAPVVFVVIVGVLLADSNRVLIGPHQGGCRNQVLPPLGAGGLHQRAARIPAVGLHDRRRRICVPPER